MPPCHSAALTVKWMQSRDPPAELRGVCNDASLGWTFHPALPRAEGGSVSYPDAGRTLTSPLNLTPPRPPRFSHCPVEKIMLLRRRAVRAKCDGLCHALGKCSLIGGWRAGKAHACCGLLTNATLLPSESSLLMTATAKPEKKIILVTIFCIISVLACAGCHVAQCYRLVGFNNRRSHSSVG